MGLKDRHKAFLVWFTPKRRRRAGATVLAIWAVGLIVYPSTHWGLLTVPGLMWFMSGWPPELHDKR